MKLSIVCSETDARRYVSKRYGFLKYEKSKCHFSLTNIPTYKSKHSGLNSKIWTIEIEFLSLGHTTARQLQHMHVTTCPTPAITITSEYLINLRLRYYNTSTIAKAPQPLFDTSISVQYCCIVYIYSTLKFKPTYTNSPQLSVTPYSFIPLLNHII